MNLQGLFALSVSVGKIDQLVAAKSRFVEADGNLRIQILAFLLVAATAKAAAVAGTIKTASAKACAAAKLASEAGTSKAVSAEP